MKCFSADVVRSRVVRESALLSHLAREKVKATTGSLSFFCSILTKVIQMFLSYNKKHHFAYKALECTLKACSEVTAIPCTQYITSQLHDQQMTHHLLCLDTLDSSLVTTLGLSTFLGQKCRPITKIKVQAVLVTYYTYMQVCNIRTQSMSRLVADTRYTVLHVLPNCLHCIWSNSLKESNSTDAPALLCKMSTLLHLQ